MRKFTIIGIALAATAFIFATISVSEHKTSSYVAATSINPTAVTLHSGGFTFQIDELFR